MKIIFRFGLRCAVALLLLTPVASPQSQDSAPQTLPATPAKPETQAEPSVQPPSPSEQKTKKSRKEKKKRTQPDPNAPRKIVVKEGGTSETPTQVAPKVEPGQVNYERESTTGLIAATEKNLERLKDFRLSKDQKATVEQIRLFLQQARDAFKQADFGRAHTLAMKARLLSDDLLPH
jgi:hypothetical protein